MSKIMLRTLLFLMFTTIWPVLTFSTRLDTNTFSYIGQPANVNHTLFILGGYRYYNPKFSVFLKQDSYSPFMNNHTFNGFSYSAGNPILQQDPSGHWPTKLWSQFQDGLQTLKQWWYGKNLVSRVDTEEAPEGLEESPTFTTSRSLGQMGIVFLERKNKLSHSIIGNDKDPISQKPLQADRQVIFHWNPITQSNDAMYLTKETARALKASEGRCLVCHQLVNQYETTTLKENSNKHVSIGEQEIKPYIPEPELYPIFVPG